MKTKREYFTEIKNILSDNKKYDEYVKFLKRELDTLKRKSEEARDSARARGALTDKLTKDILIVFADGGDLTAEDLLKIVGGTPAQISYRCNELARQNVLNKFEVVRNKRKLVAYNIKK